MKLVLIRDDCGHENVSYHHTEPTEGCNLRFEYRQCDLCGKEFPGGPYYKLIDSAEEIEIKTELSSLALHDCEERTSLLARLKELSENYVSEYSIARQLQFVIDHHPIFESYNNIYPYTLMFTCLTQHRRGDNVKQLIDLGIATEELRMLNGYTI